MSKLSSQGVEYFPFTRHSSSSLHLGFCLKVVSSEMPSQTTQIKQHPSSLPATFHEHCFRMQHLLLFKYNKDQEVSATEKVICYP